MAEYIEREALYRKICELEELARNRYLDTPSNSPAYPRYMAQLNERTALKHLVFDMPAADVEPVRHGRCGVCSGKQIITQDCDNGYSLEIDNEQSELAVWFGDQCIAVFSIDYCPNCGAKMDEEVSE